MTLKVVLSRTPGVGKLDTIKSSKLRCKANKKKSRCYLCRPGPGEILELKMSKNPLLLLILTNLRIKAIYQTSYDLKMYK